MLKTALEWLEKGVAVIPLRYKDKRPALSSWREYQDRLPTQGELYNWFLHQKRNIGLVTGWQDITVLDFDTMSSYAEWYEWCMKFNSLVAQYCYRVLTARGVHVYIKLEGAKTCKFEGGDVKASGGYVLIPPSIHPSGWHYQVLDPKAPIVEVGSLEEVLPETKMRIVDTEQPSTLECKPLDAWDASMRPQGQMGMIQTVKESVSILDLLPAGSEPITKDGRWYQAWCPFHPDKQNGNTRSMWIDTVKGIAGCHACGFKPLDAINFYSRLKGLDNREALLQLALYYVAI